MPKMKTFENDDVTISTVIKSSSQLWREIEYIITYTIDAVVFSERLGVSVDAGKNDAKTLLNADAKHLMRF